MQLNPESPTVQTMMSLFPELGDPEMMHRSIASSRIAEAMDVINDAVRVRKIGYVLIIEVGTVPTFVISRGVEGCILVDYGERRKRFNDIEPAVTYVLTVLRRHLQAD